jgi:hypothetical protein
MYLLMLPEPYSSYEPLQQQMSFFCSRVGAYDLHFTEAALPHYDDHDCQGSRYDIRTRQSISLAAPSIKQAQRRGPDTLSNVI